MSPPATRRARALTATAAPSPRSFAPESSYLRPFVNNDPSAFRESEEDTEDNGVETRDSITKTGGCLRRYEALEDLLNTRPNREILVDRNILKGDQVSGRITAAQEQLKKQLIEDALSNQIQTRPELKDLVDQNIIKNENDDTFKQAKEQLNRRLTDRKKPADLIQAKILQTDSVSGAAVKPM